MSYKVITKLGLIVVGIFILLSDTILLFGNRYQYSPEIRELIIFDKLLGFTLILFLIMLSYHAYSLLIKKFTIKQALRKNFIILFLFAIWMFPLAYKNIKDLNKDLNWNKHWSVYYKNYILLLDQGNWEWERVEFEFICKSHSISPDICTPAWYQTSDLRKNFILQDYREVVWRALIILPLMCIYFGGLLFSQMNKLNNN